MGRAVPNGSVAETAWWTAALRAEESARGDALFRDPFASRLADSTGPRFAHPWSRFYSWAAVTRTYLFDRYVAEQVSSGVDTVLDLGAGLDVRPYRLSLPRSLRWIEVDHPDVLAHKESVLRGELPRCTVERVPLDLGDPAARCALFDAVGRDARRALVISEGLVLYFTADEVGRLAIELAACGSLHGWVLDLVSPELMWLLRANWLFAFGPVSEAIRFGPVSGVEFFSGYGWHPRAVRSVFRTAAEVNRLPLGPLFLPMVPFWLAAESLRPWMSVCVLANAAPSGGPHD